MTAAAYEILARGRRLVYRPLVPWSGSGPGDPRGGGLGAPDSAVRTGRTPRAVLAPFRPRCLTIFLSTRCNLACRYCYASGHQDRSGATCHVDVVAAAARYVASHRGPEEGPFACGFHGGTEPLLQPALIDDCLRICRDVAHESGVSFACFCTTNGVVDPDVARWANETFDGITLSWDGPPEFHDRARVWPDGSGTGRTVEETAAIFLSRRDPLRWCRVRTTVTRWSVHHLTDIVRYFRERGARNIELCPVFPTAGAPGATLLAPVPWDFVVGFLQARAWGLAHGCSLVYSGSRAPEIHGRHCTINQHNLTVSPDGSLTACFRATHGLDSDHACFVYGSYDPDTGDLRVEDDRLEQIRRAVSRPPAQCVACFNRYHCSMACPGTCPIASPSAAEAPFDCTVERSLGLAAVLQAAGLRLPVDDPVALRELLQETRAYPLFDVASHAIA